MITKICSYCKIEKSISEFHKRGQFGIRSICKPCEKEYRKEHKQFPWKIVLQNIKSRCNNPNKDNYKYYGGRGIKCLITIEELKELWFRDRAYEMKKPEIDRIDNDRNYTFDNCQFIEKIEHIKKRHQDNPNTKYILQFDKQGNFIKEWESIKEASFILKINRSSIGLNAKEKRPSAGGFVWKYKEIIQ